MPENDTVRCRDISCPQATACLRFLNREDTAPHEPIVLDPAICRLGNYQALWPTTNPNKYRQLSIN